MRVGVESIWGTVVGAVVEVDGNIWMGELG